MMKNTIAMLMAATWLLTACGSPDSSGQEVVHHPVGPHRGLDEGRPRAAAR